MSMHFLKELDKLRKQLLALAAVVEENVLNSVESLQNLDIDLAMQVASADDVIDQMEIDIEEECMKILALHQPVAVDLRFIVSALKINNDLERIGDLAAKIAYNAKDIAINGDLPVKIEFAPLAKVTRQMVQDAIDSLVNMDVVLAHKVRTSDDEANEMKHEIRQQVYQAVKKHPDKVETLMYVLGVARSLERIADLTTNIAEDVIYMIEGNIVRHSRDDIKN